VVVKKIGLLLMFLVVSSFTGGNALAEEPPGFLKQKWASDEIIVKFKEDIPNERIGEINSKQNASVLRTSRFAGFKRIKVPAGKTAEQAVEIYSRLPEVEYAELNYYVHSDWVPNDTYYPKQWNFKDIGGINLEPAWEITTADTDIIVAVLDTGVAYENYDIYKRAPDLANTHFIAGYDFVNDDNHANDANSHGTLVTGTIAQSTNNSKGAAGVAFNCTIMPVKVLDDETAQGTQADAADGIYFATDNGAKIINMSFGSDSFSITLRDAVAYAYNHGVTCICSAGNDYEYGNHIHYPAGYNDYCIAVGATRFDRTRAYYSNTGSYLDIVAPGGDMNVDQNGDGWDDGIVQQGFAYDPEDPTNFGYYLYEGTSASAPHVSGVAAMLASIGITEPDDIRQALQNTAIDLGPAGRDDEYGYGLVDAFAALNYFFEEGDFNKDWNIDIEDLQILLTYWLQNRASIDIYPDGGDGIIDFFDFAKFADIWIVANPL
jgi:serine protease